MKTLALNLDDSLVNRYSNLTPEEKKKTEKLISTVLEEILKKQQKENLFNLMEKTAEQAKENGLTIAKLAEIMDWDEQTVINLFGEEGVRHDQ